MRNSESLQEMVLRRNKCLVKLFTESDITIRLIGDPNKPAIIQDETTLLSCYVKNFDLNFTKEPYSDEIVKSIKLKHEIEVSKYELQEILSLCEHRKIFKIKLADTDLFLVGYNYINQEESAGRYPVFAKHKPKIYFDVSFAEGVVESLEYEGYTVVIV